MIRGGGHGGLAPDIYAQLLSLFEAESGRNAKRGEGHVSPAVSSIPFSRPPPPQFSQRERTLCAGLPLHFKIPRGRAAASPYRRWCNSELLLRAALPRIKEHVTAETVKIREVAAVADKR
jgi:hypothetical protein